MRIKQQISEFYRFVHLDETFLYRLYKYGVHIETRKQWKNDEMAAYDEVWSYGFCFALVDLPQAEFDDGMIVARLLTNSPSQIHHLHQQHAPEKNLFHRIHRETMPHIV